jgi:hypothetical protein
MEKGRINVYLFIGLIGVFTSASMLFTHVYWAFWGEEGIWRHRICDCRFMIVD